MNHQLPLALEPGARLDVDDAILYSVFDRCRACGAPFMIPVHRGDKDCRVCGGKVVVTVVAQGEYL